MNNPEIVYLDEPTGALDSNTAEEIMVLLKELNKQGTTIVIVTHDNNIAQKAKRVINIEYGELKSDVYIDKNTPKED